MSWIIGDGHVHLHQLHSAEAVLIAALANFRSTELTLSLDGPVARFLFLTESHGAEGFTQLAKLADRRQSASGLSVEQTSEPGTLRIFTADGQALHVVAGRQIVSDERLEVLALGHTHDYPDGRPVLRILDELEGAACLRVLPWGAGKWLGQRGRLVEEIVRRRHVAPLFLGDNSNRPAFWPLPGVFRAAAALGIRNLPGSDPLPFPGQQRKAGAFGFYLPGSVAEDQPFDSIRGLLCTPEAQPTPYGQLEGLVPFFHHQVAMQLGKKRATSPAQRP